MDSDRRIVCGACGVFVGAAGLACLIFLAYRVHRYVCLMLDGEDRWGDFVRFMTSPTNPNPPAAHLLSGVGVLTIGAFLFVKAVSGPTRFWSHTARHLLVAMVAPYGAMRYPHHHPPTRDTEGTMMLVLSRKRNDSIVVGLKDGRSVVVTVVELRGDRVRLGVVAPKDTHVCRGETMLNLAPAGDDASGRLGFYRAMEAEPDHWLLYGVFADWLEEHGEGELAEGYRAMMRLRVRPDLDVCGCGLDTCATWGDAGETRRLLVRVATGTDSRRVTERRATGQFELVTNDWYQAANRHHGLPDGLPQVFATRCNNAALAYSRLTPEQKSEAERVLAPQVAES